MRISEIKAVDSLSYGDEDLPRLEAIFRSQEDSGREFVDMDHILFDATITFLKNFSAADIRDYQENSYGSDRLADDFEKRWEHNGPFEVDLDVDDIEDFLNHFGASRDEITSTQLEYIRLRYGITKGAKPA